MQDRLLTTQTAAPIVGTCPEAVERLRADHEPRDGDVTGPRGGNAMWVARSVHEIPVRGHHHGRPALLSRLRPRFAALDARAAGPEGAGRNASATTVTLNEAASPLRIHAARECTP